jgi:hypothetical protein
MIRKQKIQNVKNLIEEMTYGLETDQQQKESARLLTCYGNSGFTCSENQRLAKLYLDGRYVAPKKEKVSLAGLLKQTPSTLTALQQFAKDNIANISKKALVVLVDKNLYYIIDFIEVNERSSLLSNNYMGNLIFVRFNDSDQQYKNLEKNVLNTMSISKELGDQVSNYIINQKPMSLDIVKSDDKKKVEIEKLKLIGGPIPENIPLIELSDEMKKKIKDLEEIEPMKIEDVTELEEKKEEINKLLEEKNIAKNDIKQLNDVLVEVKTQLKNVLEKQELPRLQVKLSDTIEALKNLYDQKNKYLTKDFKKGAEETKYITQTKLEDFFEKVIVAQKFNPQTVIARAVDYIIHDDMKKDDKGKLLNPDSQIKQLRKLTDIFASAQKRLQKSAPKND